MWTLCDLAMSLLVSKSTTFELKEFPVEPSISPMFFTPPEDPAFFNAESFLPQELVVQGSISQNSASAVNFAD
jgi:hypothetical protein